MIFQHGAEKVCNICKIIIENYKICLFSHFTPLIKKQMPRLVNNFNNELKAHKPFSDQRWMPIYIYI